MLAHKRRSEKTRYEGKRKLLFPSWQRKVLTLGLGQVSKKKPGAPARLLSSVELLHLRVT
jgi:hypothetical protein